jgi:hypothetical protein
MSATSGRSPAAVRDVSIPILGSSSHASDAVSHLISIISGAMSQPCYTKEIPSTFSVGLGIFLDTAAFAAYTPQVFFCNLAVVLYLNSFTLSCVSELCDYRTFLWKWVFMFFFRVGLHILLIL